jgi:hypothetical protein
MPGGTMKDENGAGPVRPIPTPTDFQGSPHVMFDATANENCRPWPLADRDWSSRFWLRTTTPRRKHAEARCRQGRRWGWCCSGLSRGRGRTRPGKSVLIRPQRASTTPAKPKQELPACTMGTTSDLRALWPCDPPAAMASTSLFADDPSQPAHDCLRREHPRL